MAKPLPPPDKDTRQRPDPNQPASSPYLPGKSPFKKAKVSPRNKKTNDPNTYG